MCMEDIRIGRKSQSATNFATVTTTAQRLITRSDRRIALLISCPAAQRITISESPDVTDGNGLILHAAGSPLRLHIGTDGDIVKRDLFMICDAATATIGWIETYLNEE